MIVNIICFLAGFLIAFFLIAATTKRLGTLKIDMKSSDESDIARFIFDIPLDKAYEKEGLYFIKVEKSNDLKSIK